MTQQMVLERLERAYVLRSWSLYSEALSYWLIHWDLALLPDKYKIWIYEVTP